MERVFKKVKRSDEAAADLAYWLSRKRAAGRLKDLADLDAQENKHRPD